MPRRFCALLAISAVVVAVMLAVLRPGGSGDHKSSVYANGEFAFAIDAIPWNGTAPCDPIDASNTVNVGENHEVAVCTVNEPQKGAGGADDVEAFEFVLTYDPLLNQCKQPDPDCANDPTEKCRDDNPDINAGTKLGSGVPTSPNLGTGWDCSGGVGAQPTCSGGQAVAKCMSVTGPWTSGGLSPFPLAVVTFTVLAGGTDTIVTGTNVWSGVDAGEVLPVSVSADVLKTGTAPAPTATPTATPTPCPGGICPTSTPTPTSTSYAAGSISGTVTDAEDNPIEGAGVCANSQDPDGFGSCAWTDSSGMYAIADLAPGDYVVTAGGDLGYIREYYDGVRDYDDATPVAVVEGQDTPDIDFSLDVGGTISGAVTDAQGNPIPSAWVSANPYDGSGTWNYTWTAADGSYTITGLATDQYRVWASAGGYLGEYYDGVRDYADATPVAVVEGQDAAGIDFMLDVGGTISGTVINADGNPVAGATVMAETLDGGWPYSGTTGQDGSYLISGLPTGDYEVSVWAGGYAPEYYYDVNWKDEALPVGVTEGNQTSGINFILHVGGSISGTVTDAQGNPIEGASLYAYPYGHEVPWWWAWFNRGTSAADGTYTITDIPAADYQVGASAEGYFTQYYDGVRDYDDAIPVAVTEGQNTPNVDFELDVGGTISGVVTDGQGNPIEDAWVSACPYADSGDCGHTYTAPDGSYTISGLATHSYRMWASAGGYLGEYYDGARYYDDATPVDVIEGQDTPNIDFSLNVGGRVSCSVTDSDDNPIEDARCCATRYPEGWGGSCCYTGSDGACTITNLATDSYVIEAEAEGYLTEYYDGVREWDDATPVDVVEEQEVAVSFSLDLGGTISGVVRDAEDDPIESAWVWASPSGEIPISPPLPPADGAGAWTGPDGTYTIIGLATGQYIVGADAEAYVAEYYDGVRDYDSGTPVSVFEGEKTANINFSLDLGGTVSGVVRNADGDPIEGAWVSASPSDLSAASERVYAAAISPPPPPPWEGGNAQTGPDGTYTIVGLATGAYVVKTDAAGYLDEYYDGVRHSDDATPVAVTEGEDTPDIDFTMDVGGTISGVVRDAGGQPISGVWVYADPYEWESGDTWGYAQTNTDGSYTITGLATDSYIVEAQAEDYVNEYYDGARDYDDAIPVAVTEGQNTPNVDFELDVGGRVSCLVADSDDDPLEDARCCASRYPEGWGGSCCYTGSDGACTITNLATDSYVIEAEAEGYLTEYYDGVREWDDATPVDVVEEQEVAVSFSLDLGGTISGVVSDAEGDPIEDAWVWASPSGEIPISPPLPPADGAGAWTGPDGTYTIIGLATGQYIVGAKAEAYVAEYYDGVRDYDSGTPVSVFEGEKTANINFSLDLGGTISGVVRNADGDPIEGAWVSASPSDLSAASERVYAAAISPPPPPPWEGGNAQTGPDGTYTIVGLATSGYIVEVEAAGYLDEYYDGARDYDDATPVAVTEGQNTPNVDFELDVGGAISGVVKDAQGDPIEDCHVDADPWDSGSEDGDAWTDSDGTYTMTGLATGNYIVDAYCDGYIREYYNGVRDWDDATPVGVVEGQDTPNINFELAVGGTISGIVKDAQGDPIEDAWVYADPYEWESGDTWGYAQTNTDGSYTITGLATDSYRVEAEADDYVNEYYDGARDYDDAIPVAVTEGQNTPNIDFSLDIGGTISGVVSDAQGDPLGDAWVCADPYDFNGSGECAGTRSNGTYTITGLATGDYIVEAEADDYINEYYDGVREWDDATPVGVTEGQDTPNIDFFLDIGGTISGVVTDTQGDPIEDARVRACPYTGGGYCRSAWSESDGSYTITRLAGGSYKVEAEADGYIRECYIGVRDCDDADPVAVVEGEDTSGIDFSLDEEGTISGVVKDAQGDPIEGAWVAASPTVTAGIVYPAAMSPPPLPPGGSSDYTGSDGEYTIGGLATGAYIVSAGRDGYQTQYYDGVASDHDATPVGVVEEEDTPDIDFSLALGIRGDANSDGKVSMVDAMLIAQCVVGLIDCGSIDQLMADVNCSGSVTMVDAMLVAQYVVGLIDEFPCIVSPPLTPVPPPPTPTP